MEQLKISIHSSAWRLLNRFVYGQTGPEPGAVLSPDDINLPKAMQEESDKNDEIIKNAAEKGKTANSYKVYRENLG